MCNPILNRIMLGLLLTASSSIMATEQTTYDWTGTYVGDPFGPV
jgi:hypothetical protein